MSPKSLTGLRMDQLDAGINPGVDWLWHGPERQPVPGGIKTPNGKLKFLRVTGSTAADHALAAENGPDKLRARLFNDSRLEEVYHKRKFIRFNRTKDSHEG